MFSLLEKLAPNILFPQYTFPIEETYDGQRLKSQHEKMRLNEELFKRPIKFTRQAETKLMVQKGFSESHTRDEYGKPTGFHYRIRLEEYRPEIEIQ